MLSRYQIKSTQLPKPSTKSIESNAIHFTCAFYILPLDAMPLVASCTQFECSAYMENVNIDTHKCYSIHSTQLHTATKHKHSTQ